MNYCETIDSAVEFIETHLKEELTAEQIAEQFGYSLYHFGRIFALQTGTSLMNYVHLRRLSVARTELTKGKKILDVALEYGYETASGFAKSFRREFGYSPSTYMKRMQGIDHKRLLTKIGEYVMNPMMVKREAFKVAGYGIKTNVASSDMKDIAAYWEHYTGENLESKMYAQLNPPKHGEYGLCVSSPDEETVTYLLGVLVEDFSKVTPDMIAVEVPAAQYAVFTTPEVDLTHEETYDEVLSGVIKSTWKYIFEEWFPGSGYVYDESKMDFEFYDERCHFRPDGSMEIWVPVSR